MTKFFLRVTLVIVAGVTPIFGQNAAKSTPAPKVKTANPLTVELETTRDLAAKGQFPEAEKHAVAALALDPQSLTALVFLARTVKAQVQKSSTPENQALAQRAIDLYGRVLKRMPNDLEAFEAIDGIYWNLSDEAHAREWDRNIAQNGAFPNLIRVNRYQSLVYADVACVEAAVRAVFARPREGAVKGQPRVIDTEAVDRGVACGGEGLEFADAMAILSPEDAAWHQRVKLLHALVTLTTAAGRISESQGYQAQADEAEKRAAMEDPIRAAGFLPPVPVDTRQVINHLALVIPVAIYPAVAKAAHAEGIVYLNLTIDPEGFVVAAELSSGHPLLRTAAFNSAVWSRFDLTKMKTKNGVLSVEFKSDQPGPRVIANPPPRSERRDPRWRRPQ